MFWLNRAGAKRRLKQTVEEQLAAHVGGPPLRLRHSPDHLQALPVWLRTVAPSPGSDVSDWVGGDGGGGTWTDLENPKMRLPPIPRKWLLSSLCERLALRPNDHPLE